MKSPGARTSSARHAYCHVRGNTPPSSARANESDKYHDAGGWDAASMPASPPNFFSAALTALRSASVIPFGDSDAEGSGHGVRLADISTAHATAALPPHPDGDEPARRNPDTARDAPLATLLSAMGLLPDDTIFVYD